MTFRGILALVAVLAGLSGLPAGALAQSGKSATVEVLLTGKEDQATVDKMVGAAAKGGRAVSVRIVEPKPEAAKAPEIAEHSFSSLVLQGTIKGLEAIPAMAQSPGVFHTFFTANDAQLGVSGFLRMAGVLAIACLLAFAAKKIIRHLLTDRSKERDDHLKWRLFEAGKRLVADAGALAVFVKVSFFFGYLALRDLPLLMDLGSILVGKAIMVALYVIGTRFLLHPVASGSRLVPLPRADIHSHRLFIYAFAGSFVLLTNDVMKWAGSSIAERSGWFMLAGTLVALYKVWMFWGARNDLAALVRSGARVPESIHPVRRFMAVATGPIFALSAIAIWLLGRVSVAAPSGVNWGEAAGLTQFYVVLTPLIVEGLKQLLRDWFETGTTGEREPLAFALKETGLAALVGAVWVVAILDLGRLWSGFLEAALGETGIGVLRGITAGTVTGIAGLLVWIFLKRLFECYVPQRGPAIPGQEEEADESHPTVESRLSSILPVLRGIILALVIGLTVLLVMTRLGIDTGPLLAGFGLLGLALSFGSQTLVKDVVAGIFFMADDAFRVGEYIDTGKLKGTVEKLSLRALQLRHQSGLIHTVPYGQLQAVTNASRDWATVKFPIRLDHTADIEKTRKIIKKIGQELLKHEEFGEDFLMPVKFQGIVDVQDNALVARVKFTAKPFRTSQIQREALKRIYLALTEAKIPLATSSVVVRNGAPEAAAAAVMLAQTAAPAAP